jgi:N-acetylglucosaminyl-diphospho-decaprenol L-rhamnosyltransferase
MSSPQSPRHAPAEVRIVCVTYRPGEELVAFVESLAAATARQWHLVLVQNGPESELVGRLAAQHAAEVVSTGRNLGYGTAANRGAAGGREPWVVVANPDVVWHDGALDTLLDAAERHPRAGALGPALRNTDGSPYPSARELPSLRQGAGHALLGRVWPHNPWTRAYQSRQENVAEVERDAGWLSGACLALRRTAFEQVGGFDEGYFMFFEDLDLGERLVRAGWSNVYVPQAVVTHVGGTSWRARPAPMIRAHHRSAERYLRRRYTRWYHAPVRLAVTVGLRIRERVELRAAERSTAGTSS